MNLKAFSIIAASVVAALVGGYWITQRSSVPAPPPGTAAGPARPALTVQTVTPVRGQVPLTLTAQGGIAAWQEAIVGTQSNGLRLTRLHAQVGDWVRKGQLLAEFAADTVHADLLQARAALLEAQAQAADARSNADRARSIADTGALSTQQIHQFDTAAKATSARVEAARAALDAQQLRLGYTRVLAPDAGVIAARSATVGAVVPAGTELFRMVRQGRLEWRAEVVARDLPRLQPGQKARVRTPAGTMLDGTVRQIAPTLDAQRRVALVYVDLPDAMAHGARAGMYASGTFVLGEAAGWLVPQSAVVSRDGLSYVFAVGPDGRVQQRRVETGARMGEQVQILQGVDGSAPLVRTGGGFLNDGDTVSVQSAR